MAAGSSFSVICYAVHRDKLRSDEGYDDELCHPVTGLYTIVVRAGVVQVDKQFATVPAVYNAGRVGNNHAGFVRHATASADHSDSVLGQGKPDTGGDECTSTTRYQNLLAGTEVCARITCMGIRRYGARYRNLTHQ